MSIQLTSAVALPLFPALSTNSKVNEPFSLNTTVFEPSIVLVIVMSSLGFAKVAVTCPLVQELISYSTVAVGASLSIQLTVAVILDSLPRASTAINWKEPLDVNVCVSPPSEIIVSSASNPLKVTTTSLLVGEVVL